MPRANYVYRALSNYADNYGQSNNWRASASYVTGAHSLKVGYQGQLLRNDTNAKVNPRGSAYTFNQGLPVSFTMRLPEWQNAERTSTSSAFVQDTWTRGRLTLQGALRFDRAWSWSPEEGNGTTATSPVNLAAITFPRTPSVDAFNDLTPRMGVAYDVFGNGKTALKFNAGHYLDAATNDSAFTRNNPASAFIAATGTGRTVTQVTRNWSDTDGDRVVDCDLLNFGAQTAQDNCAALTGDNLNFGRSGSNLTQINQDTLKGWGVRENDWQWGVTAAAADRAAHVGGGGLRTGVVLGLHRDRQHRPRSVAVRRVDDHRADRLAAAGRRRLPDHGVHPTAAAAALAAQNYITFESDFGATRNKLL